MDFDAWTLIINSLLIIAGWFISARWAIKQVNIAHQKNRELQNELLQQAMKDSLYKEFLSLCLNIMESINQLHYAINAVGLNMTCDEHKPNDKIVFGWRDLMDKANDGYFVLGRHMDKLEIWLDVSSEYIKDTKAIYSLINEYRANFTTESRGEGWIALQANSVGILKNNAPDSKRYATYSKPVLDALNDLRFKLKNCGRVAHKYLLTREEVHISA